MAKGGTEIKLGARLGKWTLLERLDSGGNGTVWLVEGSDGALGALKILKNAAHPKSNRRFRDEVETMNACKDVPGVLPVLDQHLPPDPSEKNPAWFVMPRATPLEDSLPSGLDDAVDVCLSLAETLASLHDRGVSHRDVKLGNVLKLNGKWHLGDFGLVDFPGKADLTKPGEKLGPQHYIAPEMLEDGSVGDGRAADVYSLGKLLWKLGTGQKFPMSGMIVQSIVPLTLSGNVAAPRTASLDVLLEAMTHVDPAKRPSMRDVARELRHWRSPPAEATGPTDLFPLAKRVQALVGNFNAEQGRLSAEKANAEKLVEALLARVQPAIQKIGQAVDSAHIGIWTGEQIDGSTIFFDPSIKNLGSYEKVCVAITTRVVGERCRAILTSGVNFGMISRGGHKNFDISAPALVAAGHSFRIEEPLEGGGGWDNTIVQVPWKSATSSFVVGRPTQDEIVTHLTNELVAMLSPALTAMIAAFESAMKSSQR